MTDNQSRDNTPNARASRDVVLVYATFPDEQAALRIAEIVVTERLAACVNVLGPMTSVYEWQGKLERTIEVASLFKTRREIADRLIARILVEHPYDTPAAVVLPIEGGNPDFIEWIARQTG